MEKERRTLTMSKFIYLAATDEEFREEYIENPSKLFSDFDIPEKDRDKIDKLKFDELKKQIEQFAELDMISDTIGQVASHTKDSHVDHWKGDHNNDSHSNGTSERIDNRLDTIVNILEDYNMTIAPTEIFGQQELER